MTDKAMRNSAAMTLEERVVQKIKDDTLMAVIGDEDAILELTKRALHEALFQPRRNPDQSYGSVRELDSPVVEAAREAARLLAKGIASTLLADEDVKVKVGEAIAKAVPAAIAGQLHDFIRESVRYDVMDSQSGLMNAIAASLARRT